MDLLERNFCLMECGEEQLEECQEVFYKTRLKDLQELLQMVESCSMTRSSPGGHIDANLVEACQDQNVTNPPRFRPLVVLDPATLNKIATSNSARASSPSVSSSPPASGHCLPALAPQFKQLRTVSMPASNVPQEPITLAELLKHNGPPKTYPGPQPGQRPLVRVTFPAGYSPKARASQTCGATQRPQIHRIPSHLQVRPSRPQVPTPTNQAVTGQTCMLVPHPPSGAPPPYYQALSTFHASSQNGIVPRLCHPIPSNPSPSLNLTETQRIPDPPVESINPVLNEMHDNFNKDISNVIPNKKVQCDTQSTVTPPELPLLPQTRPETASDSRPRRPGPASRTQRLPSVSPSSEAIESVDLTDDDRPTPTPKKLRTTEKTFPSLIVSAVPSLKIFSTALVNNERLLMDNQIRKVMQMPAPVFTEYLLQQKLLKLEQSCKDHHKSLKLGIYSDPKRFPVSGGYVWIADCCKNGFCSVYAGSIFDKTLQSPSNIVKLMYHWACNTAVHNVLNWVKVDSYIMKTYNTFFRAVCTIIVQQKFPLLGGASKKIQVGVISIGTFPEGSVKEVKVDIMAVMDPDIPSIRLKVLENFLSDSNKVYESKFRKILEVLKEWVHPQSIIITDFAVDLTLAKEYGFSYLMVSGGRHSPNNNNGVMDYMRAKIPIMFSNTLGLLSYTIIQQFLDELVWREMWGPFPSRAYESLVEHLAELTKLPGPDLITKLKSIAADPTKDWRYSVWQETGVSIISENSIVGEQSKAKEVSPQFGNDISKKRKSPKESSSFVPVEETKNKALTNSVDQLSSVDPAVTVPLNMVLSGQQKDGDRKIFLELYYYGFVDGIPSRQKCSGSFLAECALCNRDFLSASSFTNHLIHHALNSKISKASPDQLLNVCTICCKAVRNIDVHKRETHPSLSLAKQSFMCRICHIDFKTEEKIVKHMTFVHQELDLPYKCDLCRYQTSIYDRAVIHFKDCHDKEYCVRCPYCFKTVRFCSKNGIEITKNQYYFVQHVQKHSLSKLNRKCEKCLLSFTNMATLKQHQEKVHKRSGRLLRNVQRVKLEKTKMLMMSFPNQAPLPPVTLHENNFHTLKGKALSSSVVLPEYYAVCSCLECDGPLTQNHFSVKMTCTRCSFQSCCANSIREHSARLHLLPEQCSEGNKCPQIIGGCPAIGKLMYCTFCAFSSVNGNKLAAHLVVCGDGRASVTSDKRKLEALVHSPHKTQKNQ